MAINTRPSTLTKTHEYNLRNQGWPETFVCAPNRSGNNAEPVTTDPVAYTKTWIGKYPSNADVIYLSRLQGAGEARNLNTYSPWDLDKIIQGNTPAARGHYILDAFDRNRQTVAGISGIYDLSRDVDPSRPLSVAFCFGRVWYLMRDGHLYYSQTILDIDQASKCYQEADPTAEDVNELIATDGGEIDITGVARAHRLVSTGDDLLIMADNGIWSVSGGSDTGFTATNQIIRRITYQGILGPESSCVAEGSVFYWGEGGIYTLIPNDATGVLQAVNLSETTIQTFYIAIPENGKKYCRSKYDPRTKKIFWLYNDDVDYDGVSFRYAYNKALIFDLTLGAFYTYSFPYDVENLPMVSGLFEKDNLSFSIVQEEVTDNDITVTDSGVTVTSAELQAVKSEVRLKVFTTLRNPNIHPAISTKSLTITGYAPVFETTSIMDVGALTLTGYDLTVSSEAYEFANAELIFSTYAPTANVTGYFPSTGTLVTTTYAPVLERTYPAGLGTLALTTYTPSITVSTGALAMTNHTVEGWGFGYAAASVVFETDGQLLYNGISSYYQPDEWWTAEPVTGIGSSYEVALTSVVSGISPTSGAVGTYYTISSDRTWTYESFSEGFYSGVWRFRVRKVSDPTIYVEADVTVYVTVETIGGIGNG